MTPLRRQMIEDMIARGFSRRTQKSYLHAVTELARFHGKSPDRLTPREAPGGNSWRSARKRFLFPAPVQGRGGVASLGRTRLRNRFPLRA